MILVSGSNGFIGSHLVERLLNDRFDALGVDDLRSSPITPEQWMAEAGPILSRGLFYKESIQYYAMRGQATHKLTGIYHLASPVGPAGILPYAGYIVEEIVDATRAVIELALIHHCRLVYVSTSEIYNAGGLCTETTPCVVEIANPTPRLEYAIGKLAGEIMCLNTPGLDVVIIRPFNVAGPRQSSKGGFVLPRFVQQALAGKKLTIFGDGQQLRAFTHVDDIVDGLVKAMNEGRKGQAYNLGNSSNRTTILELAKQVLHQVRPDLTIWRDTPSLDGFLIEFTDGKKVYGPTYAEASDKYPDATKAMITLNWYPQWGIEKTIADVVSYERDQQKL